ncbi:Protein-arginine kinase activator protein [Lentibacillus sp. JNUCC-1]|uniref:UvrB/UvrC motif-containing protein n=1 Tax=Lentibacillus sp. JNUCC-1 TaxID=2654513 RepID=UPI0012E79623|nr:UvrB/UvrC motif-containing protein [Lentibacillus sp. JNUCC-1]MUV38055.1 Protein-arginine kinase activator protein [Lentibacillus sp. JNUCC-1]
MQCEECQKRPATLHLKQVINGETTERHVCEQCAKEKGYMGYPEEGYSLHHLLSGLFNFDSYPVNSKKQGAQPFQPIQTLQCEKCGMTFSQFKQTGKFGCAKCYETFNDRLDSIFRRVHSGNTQHHGKIPKRRGGDLHTKKQLDAYKSELKSLIEQEAFEDAALVRDKIKELEQTIRDGEAGDGA